MAYGASIIRFGINKEPSKSLRCRSVYRDGLAILEIFSAQIVDSPTSTGAAKNTINQKLTHFHHTYTAPLPPIVNRSHAG